MKRFILRKIKQHAYSRQGWILKTVGDVYAIYDREWQKNAEACNAGWWSDCAKQYKYINDSRSKVVAQYWADWLNTNRAEEFGYKITIPMNVFNEGLKLYHQEKSSCQT